MKVKPLVRKIKALLNAKKRKQLAKYESLEKVLRKLKKKRDALRARLEDEKNKDRRRTIERKLKVVDAQRKKGVKLKRELEGIRESDLHGLAGADVAVVPDEMPDVAASDEPVSLDEVDVAAEANGSNEADEPVDSDEPDDDLR